jgi:hypothetical protein
MDSLVFRIFYSNLGKIYSISMDYKVVGSLFSMIIFIIFASSYTFRYVKRMGVRDEDNSLIIRSLLVGLVTYLSMNIN